MIHVRKLKSLVENNEKSLQGKLAVEILNLVSVARQSWFRNIMQLRTQEPNLQSSDFDNPEELSRKWRRFLETRLEREMSSLKSSLDQAWVKLKNLDIIMSEDWTSKSLSPEASSFYHQEFDRFFDSVQELTRGIDQLMKSLEENGYFRPSRPNDIDWEYMLEVDDIFDWLSSIKTICNDILKLVQRMHDTGL